MSNLTVQDFQGELVVDSRLIAERLGIQHESLLKTIRKHRERVEARFGSLRFEIGYIEMPKGGAREEVTHVLLTEPQASVLMTLSKNTEQVVECKLDLVDAFEKAKSIIKTVIPAQNDRIRELELEIRLREMDNTMLTLHGKETVLALRGLGHQVIETEKPILEVVNQRSNQFFQGQTCKQVADYVAKRFGRKFKSGADVERVLRAAGRDDLLQYIERPTKQACVPKEALEEVYSIICAGDRQGLLGE